MKRKWLIKSIAICLIFSGCVAARPLPSINGNENTAYENDKNNFIELFDGGIIEGEINKNNLRSWVIGLGRGGIIFNGNKYEYKNVVAYQENKIYHRQNIHKNFSKRIIKGKINVYSWVYTRSGPNVGNFSTLLYYIQKGDKGDLVELNKKTLEIMVSDYDLALAKLHIYNALNKKEKKQDGYSSFNNIISIYNRQN